MQTTAMGIILELAPEQKNYIDALMGRYCAAVRWSFKRLLDGLKVQPIRKTVQRQFSLNSRQANDAVYEAQSIIKSQHKLVQMNYKTARARAEFTQKRINRARSQRKITLLQTRLDKEQRKLAKWQHYVETKTFPPVVFGGKQLFQERCKGNITKKEWQEARTNRYLSRGDKTKGGNLNTRLYHKGSQIYLDIAAEPVKTCNPVRYKRITVPIYLAHKPSQKTGRINGTNYRQMVLDYLKTGNAYQVEILRRNNKYYIHVTIEEETFVPQNMYGAIGIDTNPGGLGIAIVDYLGQYQGSQWIKEHEWCYARTNRRTNLIGKRAKQIVNLAKEKGYGLAVEDLKFRNDRSITAKFNRMAHGFVWSKFLEYICRCAAREGVPLIKVNPAFTSIIGILKYQPMYGTSGHESAAYVIARRALGFSDDRVPRLLFDKLINKKSGFKHMNGWKKWSAVNKALLPRLKNITERQVRSLVYMQVHRKELLCG